MSASSTRDLIQPVRPVKTPIINAEKMDLLLALVEYEMNERVYLRELLVQGKLYEALKGGAAH